MTRQRRVFDIVLIVTFLCGLSIPLVFTRNRDISTVEKRQLAPLPEWEWERETMAAFPQTFQSWFTDHFGFRDNLAQLYYLLGVGLGSSGSSVVLIGKQGWLFYNHPFDGNNLEDYRRNDGLTPEDLQKWRTILEARYRDLKEQGINYLFVIPPNKQSVYPEFFPSRFRTVGTVTRLDQFMAYMRDSEVPVLDLREPLIQAKTDGQVFFKTDTHWNVFGAAVAQNEIMRQVSKLYPGIQTHTYGVDDFVWDSDAGGDMAGMLNLSDILKEEPCPALRQPIAPFKVEIIEENTNNPVFPTFMTTGPSNGPSVLVFRDSFFSVLSPYISQYCSTCLFVAKYPDSDTFTEYVERYRPDIVIEERTERLLKSLPAN